MTLLTNPKEALGALSVALALIAAVVYVWQTIAGQVRPHPLSWTLFGVLSGTGYWVQRTEGAQAGSWALLAMTVICFVFAGAGVARGERRFPRREWAFLAAGCAVFLVYLVTRQPTLAAILVTLVDALAYGPTFSRGWSQPWKDSVISFALNGVKFVPSILAMEPISIATCAYPATLIVLNATVSTMLILRRRALSGGAT
ncbi:MAG TPA: hypothetical protein VGH40_00255 [Roseiarcus sp.]|jgi:hypothetical protein